MEKTPRRIMRRQSDHGTQAPYFVTVSAWLTTVIIYFSLGDYSLNFERLASGDFTWTDVALDVGIFFVLLWAVQMLLRMVVPAYRGATR